jgi:hypothetical protein
MAPCHPATGLDPIHASHGGTPARLAHRGDAIGGLIPGPPTNRWPYGVGPLTTPALTCEGDFEVRAEQPPTDSAPAPSSWSGATGAPGDLFTPRQQHTPPGSSHQHAGSPPSPGRQAGQPVQAQVDQPVPQPPRQWALPRLSRPRVTAAALTLALPAAAVIVLLAIAHYTSAPIPTPPLVTQISGPAASPAPTAAAPPTTIPLPAPAPADAAEPSLAPTPVIPPQTSPVIPQAAPASAPPESTPAAPAPPWLRSRRWWRHPKTRPKLPTLGLGSAMGARGLVEVSHQVAASVTTATLDIIPTRTDIPRCDFFLMRSLRRPTLNDSTKRLPGDTNECYLNEPSVS